VGVVVLWGKLLEEEVLLSLGVVVEGVAEVVVLLLEEEVVGVVLLSAVEGEVSWLLVVVEVGEV
jgi:hypothetical protein